MSKGRFEERRERLRLEAHINADPALVAVTGRPMIMLHAARTAGVWTGLDDDEGNGGKSRQYRCRLPKIFDR